MRVRTGRVTVLRPAAQQTIELPLGDPVTLAGPSLQAATVPDRNVASLIVD